MTDAYAFNFTNCKTKKNKLPVIGMHTKATTLLQHKLCKATKENLITHRSKQSCSGSKQFQPAASDNIWGRSVRKGALPAIM
jgi:hypothetical protein